jgi:hypothetical protein
MSDTFEVVLQPDNPGDFRDAFTRAYRFAEVMLSNGERMRLRVEIDDNDVRHGQRKFLHGIVLKQISEQVRVGETGDRYVISIWKEYYRKLFLPDVWEHYKLPGEKRATPRRVRQSTEDLGVKAYHEFTERVIAHAETEWGVEFVFEEDGQEYLRRKPGTRQNPKHKPILKAVA